MGITGKIKLFIILFCYVFAFYIGPISVSILISLPLYVILIFNRTYRGDVKLIFKLKYIYRIIIIWVLILFYSVLVALLSGTFDFSFSKIISIHFVHYLSAIPVLAYLKYSNYTQYDIETQFINIFIAQTFIQFIVLSNSTLKESIRFFNHYDPAEFAGLGANIRGVALSAATTFHLTLSYGLGFIIYIKHYLSKRISLCNIIIGLIIISGIFCAGRSGFIGCALGLIGMLFYNIRYKIASIISIIFNLLIKSAISILGLYLILSCVTPRFFEILDEKVLPYAFEFVDNYNNSGTIETASTNQLGEMWNSNLDIQQLIIGSGHYTGTDGRYYMHVDPGVLRHLLFFGIFGYILLFIYQYNVIALKSLLDENKYYMGIIFIFIIIMDFKGTSVGGNKFMVFIPLLLSYCYHYLPNFKIK